LGYRKYSHPDALSENNPRDSDLGRVAERLQTDATVVARHEEDTTMCLGPRCPQWTEQSSVDMVMAHMGAGTSWQTIGKAVRRMLGTALQIKFLKTAASEIVQPGPTQQIAGLLGRQDFEQTWAT
jgi:hypothetical protein